VLQSSELLVRKEKVLDIGISFMESRPADFIFLKFAAELLRAKLTLVVLSGKEFLAFSGICNFSMLSSCFAKVWFNLLLQPNQQSHVLKIK